MHTPEILHEEVGVKAAQIVGDEEAKEDLRLGLAGNPELGPSPRILTMISSTKMVPTLLLLVSNPLQKGATLCGHCRMAS